MINPLLKDEDFYIPISSSSIGVWIVSDEQQKEDIEYFRKSLSRALNIPYELMGYVNGSIDEKK